MKRAIISVVLPILVVLIGVLGFVWWERGAPPGMRPTPVDVTPSSVTLDNRGVHMRITAHYEGRIEQRMDGEVFHLYPIFDKGDRESRHARVILRTRVPASTLYAFEERTITGFARPPGRLLPKSARDAFEKRGYSLDEHLVLIDEWEDLAETTPPAG